MLIFLIHSGKFSPEMKDYNTRYEYQTHDQDSGGSNGKTRRVFGVESKHTVRMRVRSALPSRPVKLLFRSVFFKEERQRKENCTYFLPDFLLRIPFFCVFVVNIGYDVVRF